MPATRVTFNTDQYSDERESRKAIAAAMEELSIVMKAEQYNYVGKFRVPDHQGNTIHGDIDEL